MAKRETVIIHCEHQIAAAAQAAIAADVDLCVLTAPGASAYLGPAWLSPAAAEVRARMRAAGRTLDAYMDCADRAGDAMAALREGAPGVIFTGGGDVAEKLAAMAGELGVPFMVERPTSLDLQTVDDVAAACAAMFGAR